MKDNCAYVFLIFLIAIIFFYYIINSNKKITGDGFGNIMELMSKPVLKPDEIERLCADHCAKQVDPDEKYKVGKELFDTPYHIKKRKREEAKTGSWT